MATARTWRTHLQAEGPHAAGLDDIAGLNQVFSDAFSERYRRDGMVGVRVPFLNPAIWRYAIEDADGGALVWRDDRDDIVAFNIAHRSGVEGWMGPLAVRPDWQGVGLGKEIVRGGVDWLRKARAATIGLETMPRTMDNIGFYSALGFVPGRLTITLTLEAGLLGNGPNLLGRLAPSDKDDAIEECRALANRLAAGFDFTREIVLTDQLALGDTVLLRERGRLIGFALCHTAPLVEGRVREEMRVLKLALDREDDLPRLADVLMDYARRSGTRRVALRVQTEFLGAYQRLIDLGARVRWTDLRMTLADMPERPPQRGVIWSNWEI
jgi:GNAT superfamily N-acetyltransferase